MGGRCAGPRQEGEGGHFNLVRQLQGVWHDRSRNSLSPHLFGIHVSLHLVSSPPCLLTTLSPHHPVSSPQTPSLDTFVAAFGTLPLSPGLYCGEVVRRILAEESFWAREPLTCLLEAHLCPPRYTHTLSLCIITLYPSLVFPPSSLPTCIHAPLPHPNYSLCGEVLDTAAKRNDWVRRGRKVNMLLW